MCIIKHYAKAYQIEKDHFYVKFVEWVWYVMNQTCTIFLFIGIILTSQASFIHCIQDTPIRGVKVE